jgi:hypothetical protein
VLRLLWRFRPFLAVGAATVIIVNGDTGVEAPDVRSLAPGPAARWSASPVPDGPTLVTVGPSRLLDTRATGALGAGTELPVVVLGRLGVPAEHVSGAVLSVTVVDATLPTSISIGPSGGRAAELIEARSGAAASAVVTTGLGDDGAITVTNASGDANVVIDVAAYVLARP